MLSVSGIIVSTGCKFTQKFIDVLAATYKGFACFTSSEVQYCRYNLYRYKALKFGRSRQIVVYFIVMLFCFTKWFNRKGNIVWGLLIVLFLPK